MNKKLYKTIGRPFINLPSTQKNKFNNKQRNVGEIEMSSASLVFARKDHLFFVGNTIKHFQLLDSW